MPRSEGRRSCLRLLGVRPLIGISAGLLILSAGAPLICMLLEKTNKVPTKRPLLRPPAVWYCAIWPGNGQVVIERFQLTDCISLSARNSIFTRPDWGCELLSYLFNISFLFSALVDGPLFAMIVASLIFSSSNVSTSFPLSLSLCLDGEALVM